MKSTNAMIEFAKNNRTTTFFRNSAIVEIRIAYAIMEYLAPDDTFQPEIIQSTKDLMLKEEFSKAYECIVDELNAESSTDLGYSAAEASLITNAVELMRYLLPIYKKHVTDKKEQRRIELLKELKELEA